MTFEVRPCHLGTCHLLPKGTPCCAGWRDGRTYLKGLQVSGHQPFKNVGFRLVGKRGVAQVMGFDPMNGLARGILAQKYIYISL